MNIELNNEDILFYIGILTVLMFIWYSSQINIKYIFPFLIFCFIFYYYENKKLNDEMIKHELLNDEYIINGNYKYLVDDDILYFINSVKNMREYNDDTFKDFLHVLNEYYKDRIIDKLLVVMNKFEKLYYSIPLEMTDLFVEKQNELKKLLKNVLIQYDINRVEMQSYLPATYINNNI